MMINLILNIFFINDYLFNKINSTHQKYINLNIILKENNISVFNGNDANYFSNINSIINIY
jgi:hypothetical protein